jgi:hypothetical protein
LLFLIYGKTKKPDHGVVIGAVVANNHISCAKGIAATRAAAEEAPDTGHCSRLPLGRNRRQDEDERAQVHRRRRGKRRRRRQEDVVVVRCAGGGGCGERCGVRRRTEGSLPQYYVCFCNLFIW